MVIMLTDYCSVMASFSCKRVRDSRESCRALPPIIVSMILKSRMIVMHFIVLYMLFEETVMQTYGRW